MTFQRLKYLALVTVFLSSCGTPNSRSPEPLPLVSDRSTVAKYGELFGRACLDTVAAGFSGAKDVFSSAGMKKLDDQTFTDGTASARVPSDRLCLISLNVPEDDTLTSVMAEEVRKRGLASGSPRKDTAMGNAYLLKERGYVVSVSRRGFSSPSTLMIATGVQIGD